MKRVHSILFECNAYRGEASHERCKAAEEHVAGCVGPACRIESATMRENDVGGGVVQPTFEIVYTEGDYKEIIDNVDRALLDIGVVAFKALVSSLASYAVEATIAGAGAGALVGGTAAGGDRRNDQRSALAEIVYMLVGGAVGGAVGFAAERMAEKMVPCHIAVKQSGEWHIKSIPKQ